MVGELYQVQQKKKISVVSGIHLGNFKDDSVPHPCFCGFCALIKKKSSPFRYLCISGQCSPNSSQVTQQDHLENLYKIAYNWLQDKKRLFTVICFFLK